MPDSQADCFTQDQYRLSFMRLIAVLDSAPNANLNPRDLSEAGEQDASWCMDRKSASIQYKEKVAWRGNKPKRTE